MSFITQPQNLVRFTFNAVATAVEQVVGLDPDGVLGAPIPALIVPARLGGSFSVLGVKSLIPIQWEIKNDDTTTSLEVKFGHGAMTAASGTVMADTLNILPGQAYTQQKRLAVQEYGRTTADTDCYWMRVRSAGVGPVAFSGTVECWIMYSA